MKAWHLLIAAAMVAGAYLFFRSRRAEAAEMPAAGPSVFPKATTIPQTPIQVPRAVPRPVSAVRAAPSSKPGPGGLIRGAVTSATRTAIANSGIPGAGFLAGPGSKIAGSVVSSVKPKAVGKAVGKAVVSLKPKNVAKVFKKLF